MRSGILAAGNWIIDDIKIIDEYPHQDGLTNVRAIKTNNGGAAYNVLKDLAFLKAPFPLYGAGLVGRDEKGKHILEDIVSCGVDVSQLKMTEDAPTSYTDVMTVASTGRRTFFHNRGANALFSRENIDLDTNAKIFHMAYILLLDQMDELDASGRSMASYVFEEAQDKGFKTSTDIVSEASDRFQRIAPSSLPYIDYLFVNEYELSKLTGMEIMQNGMLDKGIARKAMETTLDMGVGVYCILHFPEGVMVCDTNKHTIERASLNIPSEKIKGTAGAGDAFAAGMLLGLHEELPLDKCLDIAISASAACLFDESCSDGIKQFEDMNSLQDLYGFRTN